MYIVVSGRVKILSLPKSSDSLFVSIFVQFIDVGKEEEVKSHQILQLPEQFHSLPGQAMEIIVCRVKPVDVEIDWHPKVSCSPHFASAFTKCVYMHVYIHYQSKVWIHLLI